MKGNLMVRLMTLLILVGIVLAHISGQTNLLSSNWLWLAIVPAFMGLQATFTGWCPAEVVGKLSKTGECCPSGSCGTPEPASTETKSSACCGNNDTLQIKVLGTGCANCNSTVKLIQATADELGVAVEVIKVEDIAEIAAYGIMSTPGVVINDQVVHAGGIPSKKVVSEWLQ